MVALSTGIRMGHWKACGASLKIPEFGLDFDIAELGFIGRGDSAVGALLTYPQGYRSEPRLIAPLIDPINRAFAGNTSEILRS